MSKHCATITRNNNNVGLVELVACPHQCSEIIREGKMIICVDCIHLQLGTHPIKEDKK